MWREHRILTVFLGGVFALVLAYQSGLGALASEDILMRIAPSADRAYAYGTRHLDTRDHRAYDLERARHFFEQVLAINPDHNLAKHQLARVLFLEGRFEAAHRIITEAINKGPKTTSSYYVRGLIEGYLGDYEASAKDYEAYLRTDPNNWAAINDYAWVLIKAKRYRDALVALDWGLITWPDNVWLLNSKATALFELGRTDEARETIQIACAAVDRVRLEDWSKAYPGNDPLIAAQGVRALRDAIAGNMHRIARDERDGIKNVQ